MTKSRNGWENDAIFQGRLDLLVVARAVSRQDGEEPPPDLTDAVMQAVKAKSAPRGNGLARLLDWAFRPVTVRVSPFAAAGVSLALLLGAWGGWWALQNGSDGPMRPAMQSAGLRQEAGGVHIRFTLRTNNAQSVALIGTFNDWSPEAHVLHKAEEPGLWVIDTVVPPGRHEYSFLVDGRPMADPAAPVAVQDDFGNRNAVLYVPTEQTT